MRSIEAWGLAWHGVCLTHALTSTLRVSRAVAVRLETLALQQQLQIAQKISVRSTIAWWGCASACAVS